MPLVQNPVGHGNWKWTEAGWFNVDDPANAELSAQHAAGDRIVAKLDKALEHDEEGTDHA